MTIRTSESDPLRIAALPVGGGLVGVTLCPGKQGDSVSGAGWARDLAADIKAIREWDASAVVTLIEEHEFAMLGVQALPEAFREAGIEWHHLPVTDVHAPDQRFETRWGYAGARLRERLRAGERVLVHCRGGLGRAGSVAARLLAEFGTTPSEAIRQVRAVRPGAIETRTQERWVEAQRAAVEAREARASRELACLLGGAIGDALGYRAEFDSLAAIRCKHGTEGIRLAAAGGVLEVSDDTQMSLFTLEGQLRAARDTVPLNDAIRQSYLDWLLTQSVRSAATGTRQLLTEVDAALKSSKSARASASFGLGWVGDEALALGLHAAATAASFAGSIEVASNHDGDSDSTASIAGQLYGAKHGLSALPAEVVYRVDVLEPLLELFAEWEKVRSGSRP